VLIDRNLGLSGGNASVLCDLAKGWPVATTLSLVGGREVAGTRRRRRPSVRQSAREVRQWWLDGGCTASRGEGLVDTGDKGARAISICGSWRAGLAVHAFASSRSWIPASAN